MAKHNVWMSVSDLMTGLMVIFLFIAVSYMIQVDNNQQVLIQYQETKRELHDKMVSEFAGDTARWQMSIGRDLSLKFNNPTVLFASGEAELTPEFQVILDEFLPRYFDILLHDTLRTRIREIRIEGHTDDTPMRKSRYSGDPYLGNLHLSQERASNVVKYFRSSEVYAKYTPEEKQLLEFWITANGLSYGRSLDDDGKLTIESGKPINPALSRRVEFRIVTDGDQLIENFLKKNSDAD